MRLPFFRKYRFPPVLPPHLAVIMAGNGRCAAPDIRRALTILSEPLNSVRVPASVF